MKKTDVERIKPLLEELFGLLYGNTKIIIEIEKKGVYEDEENIEITGFRYKDHYNKQDYERHYDDLVELIQDIGMSDYLE